MQRALPFEGAVAGTVAARGKAHRIEIAFGFPCEQVTLQLVGRRTASADARL